MLQELEEVVDQVEEEQVLIQVQFPLLEELQIQQFNQTQMEHQIPEVVVEAWQQMVAVLVVPAAQV